jgi:hypothetical protein
MDRHFTNLHVNPSLQQVYRVKYDQKLLNHYQNNYGSHQPSIKHRKIKHHENYNPDVVYKDKNYHTEYLHKNPLNLYHEEENYHHYDQKNNHEDQKYQKYHPESYNYVQSIRDFEPYFSGCCPLVFNSGSYLSILSGIALITYFLRVVIVTTAFNKRSFSYFNSAREKLEGKFILTTIDYMST